MHKIIDLTGNIYGRLTVIKKANEKHRWVCKCSCGAKRMVSVYNLLNGTSRSCGCLKNDRVGALNRTHGMCNTKEYRAWAHMIERCNNPNDKGYSNYGGRGIKVCSQWLISFESFFEDMGLSPSKFHSIDRKDNNGNYEPSNCRWATRHEQANNKRNIILLEHNDEKKTISEWAKIVNLPRLVISNRIRKGWTIEDALTKSKGQYGNQFLTNRQPKSV